MEGDNKRFTSLIEDLETLKRTNAMLERYDITVRHGGYHIAVEVSFTVVIPPGVKVNMTEEQKGLPRG